MRREKRKSVDEGLDFKKVLYISGSILAVAIIGFVVTFFVYGNKIEQDAQIGKLNTSIIDNYSGGNTEQTSSQMGKSVNEMEQANSINKTNQVKDTNETKYAINTSKIENEISEKNANSTSEIAKQQEPKKDDQKVKNPEFRLPVSGDIVKEFAKDKLVYSNTLGEWVIHNGIDIKAEKTTVVKAASEGCVKSIKNDPRYGLTIVIEHVNGFTTIYSNLLTAEFVAEGENVKQGQTIGTVGNTATFEISDEPHLHFEILKDGEHLDPELYIKK